VTFRQGSQEQVVFALGQAARPGAYPYRWGTTIGELLAECGGPGPHAALHRALVLQGSKAEPVDLDKLLKGDTSQNRPLHPGDVLLIPEITDRVLVLGQVARPGYQDLKDDMRLIDAVTEAGPQLTAAPERITVMREGQIVKSDLETFLRKADVEQNVKLAAGDVVFVPETDRRILIMGEVGHPGPLTMSDEFPKTVMDAILAVGGPNRGAKMSDVTVVRQDAAGKTKEIHVNLDRFIHGGAADQNIPVQARDVIYVPAGFGLTFANFMGTLSNLAVLKFLLGITP